MSITKNVVFKDFDISFTKHPVTRKLNILKNDLAVARSIKSLVLTNKLERPYQPSIGSNVKARLFEESNSLTSDLIQQDIEECINLYEPRAELLGVTVQASPDLHGYNVRILFRTRNQANAVQLDLILSRIR